MATTKDTDRKTPRAARRTENTVDAVESWDDHGPDKTSSPPRS